MSQATEFCAFLSIRYLNPLLMGSAHDWIADNMPPIPEGWSGCAPSISRPTAA